jgi:hypothetical protein
VRLQAVEALGAAPPPDALGASWTPAEWQLYLDSLPRPAAAEALSALDARFGLTGRENHEVLVAWLRLGAESGYAAVLPRIEEVLGRVGRMKYLRPLYQALAKNPATRDFAVRCFEKFRAGYHPIAQQVVDGILRAAR